MKVSIFKRFADMLRGEIATASKWDYIKPKPGEADNGIRFGSYNAYRAHMDEKLSLARMGVILDLMQVMLEEGALTSEELEKWKKSFEPVE